MIVGWSVYNNLKLKLSHPNKAINLNCDPSNQQSSLLLIFVYLPRLISPAILICVSSSSSFFSFSPLYSLCYIHHTSEFLDFFFSLASFLPSSSPSFLLSILSSLPSSLSINSSLYLSFPIPSSFSLFYSITSPPSFLLPLTFLPSYIPSLHFLPP